MTLVNNAARIATRLILRDQTKFIHRQAPLIQNLIVNLHAYGLTITTSASVPLPVNSCSSVRCYSKIVEAEEVDIENAEVEGGGDGAGGEKRDPEKDRTKVIPLETSLEYMKSDAYKQTYGDTPVWVLYRRNFKGQFAPKKTRKTCIRQGQLSTGNPCPICRDEYLVLDYRNVDLLKQFISPFNGEVLHWDKTGVCRNQQFNLLQAIQKAKDYGTITFDVKFREYNYEDYYPKEQLEKLQKAGITNNIKLLEH